MKVLATIFYMLFLTSSAISQQQKNSTDSLAIVKWLTRSFAFNKPDTGFVELSEANGYSNPSLDAGIKFITFPGNYSKAKTDFLERKSTENFLLVDILYHQINNQEAVSIVREEVSPDNTKYENFISIMTLIGFGDITVCVVGAYPKSKDSILRKKYIYAGLSLREL